MASRDDIKKIIGYMILAFPNYKPDTTSHPNTVDVFEDLLGDLDADTLYAAVRAACKEPRAFAPAPGEIRAAAAALVNMEDVKQKRIAESYKRLNDYLEEKRKCLPS
jgi:hypothetical protein